MVCMIPHIDFYKKIKLVESSFFFKTVKILLVDACLLVQSVHEYATIYPYKGSFTEKVALKNFPPLAYIPLR